MIAKGNTHDNGARLARYITKGKEGELAELWELRGFALRDISDAFRSVHVTAAIGQCRQPFFHVQVRNPEGETLTRVQWNVAIDKIEMMMGLAGQPRAVAAHTDLKTRHEHIHIAWSRIDPDTLIARPLPFFKLRLKKASRELETLFGLTPVPNRRQDRIAYAPKRSEEQQSRRLGVVIHDVRAVIKTCFENADCGRGFQCALDAQGLLLARGERRDFIVLDHEGGMHAVGKRILGISAAEIRTRLADLIADHLPTVDEARAQLILRPNLAAQQVAKSDQAVFQYESSKSETPKSASRREKHGRATGKKSRDIAPHVPVVPEFREAEAPRENHALPSQCEWPEVIEMKLGPPGAAPVCEQETPALGDPPADEETPASTRKIGDILKQQFKTLVRVVTGREQTQKPKAKRRREEIGGCFKAAAAAFFRWLERISPDANAVAWEPFLWLDWWANHSPVTQDFKSDQAATYSSDQSLNL